MMFFYAQRQNFNLQNRKCCFLSSLTSPLSFERQPLESCHDVLVTDTQLHDEIQPKYLFEMVYDDH